MTSKKSSTGNNSIKAVIICGPTGSGKSALGMAVARKYSGSIISADSRQVYRRLDIGTAKPSEQDRREIPHYMIDIADVTEGFTAARFALESIKNIELIAAVNRIPLIVGGAGLYIEALTRGIFIGPGRDDDIRRGLEETARTEGIIELYNELERIDPDTAHKISPGDSVRIVRALEIYLQSGSIPSRLRTDSEYLRADAEFLWLALSPSRERLYRKIDKRVDEMIDAGLIDETRGLLEDGLGEAIMAKKIVGYYEILEALEGNNKLEGAVDLIKKHSRNYAKRQMTWFRNRTNPVWLDPEKADFHDKVNSLLDEYLKRT